MSLEKKLLLSATGPAFAVALVTLLLSALLPSPTLAGAWVQNKDGYFLKISSSYLFTRKELQRNGDSQDIFEEDQTKIDTWFRDISILLYLEYGLLDRLTLVTDLPFKISTSRETEIALPGAPARRITRTNGGLADLHLALRTPLVRGPLVMSLQGGVKIPLGYSREPDNDGPPLGTGQVDGEVFILIGQSLYPLPAYIEAGIGYRFRGGELRDEVEYAIEGGFTWGRLFAKLRFNGLQNTRNELPDLAGATVQTPLPGGGGAIQDVIAGDQDVFKLTPAVSLRLADGISINAEAYHVVSGANTTLGTTYAFGLIFAR